MKFWPVTKTVVLQGSWGRCEKKKTQLLLLMMFTVYNITSVKGNLAAVLKLLAEVWLLKVTKGCGSWKLWNNNIFESAFFCIEAHVQLFPCWVDPHCFLLALHNRNTLLYKESTCTLKLIGFVVKLLPLKSACAHRAHVPVHTQLTPCD